MAGAAQTASEKCAHPIVIFGEEDSRHAVNAHSPANALQFVNYH
jgi:hypothetical protein